MIAREPTNRPRTAILLQSHIFDGAVRRLHAALQRACGANETLVVLMHAPPGSVKPAALDGIPTHFVTTPEIRVAEYAAKSGGEAWSIWGGGHTDLIAMHFARQHPEFDHYWVIEYDVRYTGDWRQFFDHFADSPADLLATTIQSFGTHPQWSWWYTLKDPLGQDVAGADLLCAFMPIFRFSGAAFRAMDRRYREGWGGHIELTWPTFLSEAGLVIEDIGANGLYVRPQNRGLFYENRPLTWGFGPGTLVWRPARLRAGLRRNRLYHPIKPPMVALRDKWDYRRTMTRWSYWRVRDRARQRLRQLNGQWSAVPSFIRMLLAYVGF